MFQKKSNSVGICISAERKKAGLSQEALAARLHVTRQTISNWESGKSLPDIETLKELAQVLSVPIERLIYEKQPEQAPSSLAAALAEDLALEVWCRRLGIFVLVWGLLSGIRTGCWTAHGFGWPDAFSVWYAAVIRGSILLGISKILTILNKEP